MNPWRITLVSCVLAVVATSATGQVAKAVLKAGVTVVAGGAFAATAANAAEAQKLHAEKGDLLTKLRDQGVDPRDGAICSVYFNLSSDAPPIYWADLIGKPDVFIVVAVEGQGEFLIPRIAYEYSGQPLLENVITRNIIPGRKVMIYVFDDDSLSDVIWNGLLSSRMDVRLAVDIAACQPVAVNLQVGGAVKLLDRQMLIDKPDLLAYAEFLAPEAPDGRWLADAVLRAGSGLPVGKIQFAQLWKADPQAYAALVQAEARAFKWKIFWIALTTVSALIFLRLLFSRHGVASVNGLAEPRKNAV